FIIESSMFDNNVADGGQGGGLYLFADVVQIDSCTFARNSAMGGDDARGGGVYLSVEDSTATDPIFVENCTFFENQVGGGSSSSSGGGIAASGNMKIISSAFLKNTAITNGGGVIVDAGTVEISGTLIVGNNAPSDIYARANEDLRSGGYNRIGTYGIVNGLTSWKAGPGTTGDESDATWTMATFYSDNTLADNEVSGTVPPKIGATVATGGQVRLQTIMLKENENLALDLRAVNIIPWRSARFRFPRFDERGVDRRDPGVDLDIGPVFFGPITKDSDDKYRYEISRVILSGVPNEIRRVGQTASLVAKVYYSNRTTAYGGNGDNEEPVTWSVSPTGYLKISDTGVITALRVTTGQTYVTITVSTTRMNSAGEYATDTARVKIDPDLNFSDLNTSPELTNSDANTILRDLRNDFEEYNMGYGLVDKSTDTVSSDTFQSTFGTLWQASSASLVSTFTSSSVNFSTAYTASDGYTPAKGAGFTVSFAGVKTGDIMPIVFPWKMSGSELQTALGSKLYASVEQDLSMAYQYNTPINYSVAEDIFSALRFEFNGKSNSFPVLSGDSGISVTNAMEAGALALEPNDSGKGLLIKLTAYIANVQTSNAGNFYNASENYNGAKLIEGSGKKLLVVPDGSDDGEIYGTMWLAQKYSSSSASTTSSTQKTSSNTSSGGGDSGGGGCSGIRNEGLGIRNVLFMLTCFAILGVRKRSRE
ncbi:MAG: hypothetical protein IJU31_05125, partial [Synergistaceae bacterium]|nr:hypothetical protein [Synergistaceae bacterium]